MISSAKAAFIRSLEDSSGRLEPEKVIEAARPANSPIHEDFEWDLKKAAQQHWIEQARTLIRYVRLEVVIERETICVPFYVNDPIRAPKSKTYVELTSVKGQRAQALRVLEDEVDRIASALERARKVALVLGIGPDLDRLLADLNALASAGKGGSGGRSGGGGKGGGKGGSGKKPRAQAPSRTAAE
jgi:hypothetical protein